MDEHPDSALHYGHVGRAVYLPETKTWTFARSFSRCTPISYTGLTSTTIFPARNTSELQPPPQIRQQADSKLIQNAHPELAGQWPTINDDALSKVIIKAADLCDPQISGLFDLGYALDHASDDSTSIPDPVAIAAAVTGIGRDTISFRMMEDDLVEIQDDASRQDASSLLVPSIGDVETTEWSQRGAPVQQICFARTVAKKTTWMAARLKTSIVIFRPIFQPVPVPAHINVTDTEALSIPLRNSRLDANPVVEVLQDFTGGFTLANVTFNPWYSRKLGIVDIMGNWSIWEITGRQKKHGSTYAPRKLMMASLLSDRDKPQSMRPRHDGWASIEWVADSSTVVVSDRRCTMLYEITDEVNGKVFRSSIVELGMVNRSEWVLDLQRSIQDPSHFFILTTSRLLWFDVTRAPISNGTRPSLAPSITWSHFRDPEDTTLRISDLMVNGDLYLILYSRLTELVQGFPCPILEDEKTELVSVPDPFILKVPKAGNISPEDMSSNHANFVFRQIHHTSAHAKLYHNPDLTLIKLFWADQSLSIHETLFKGPENHRNHSQENAPLEGVSVLQAKPHIPPMKESKTDERGFGDEEFVVEDWDETAVSRLTLRQRVPDVSATESFYDRKEDLQWTLDWTNVYARAVEKLTVLTKPLDPEETQLTLGHIIEVLRKDPSGASDHYHASKTMLEISGDRPRLNDIDEGADDLARLVSTVLPKSPNTQSPWRYMILPLQFSNTFLGLEGISPDLRLDFLETYNHLIDEWVTLLPHGEEGIPDSTRVLKERSVRGIALDLLLARLIQISDVPNTARLSREDEPNDAPRTQQGPTLLSQHRSQELSSSQVTSTPKPSAEDKLKKPPATNYSALSTYTVFKQPRPMPQNVSNLLSHWQLGVDPATYEWKKSSRLLDENKNQAARRTPRQRLHKRRSQLMPETATAIAAAPELEPASSLPPTPVAPMIRAWGSQPDQPPMPIQSSQPTLDEEPMTQMERGLFGAREVKKSSKAAKKKRHVGF